MKHDRMTADEFTKAYPTGTPAKYWPVKGENRFIETAIRSDAWALGHGAVVVKVEGVTGCVDIGHLVLPEPTEGVLTDALKDAIATGTGMVSLSNDGYVSHVPQGDIRTEPPATIEVKGFRMQLPAGTRTGEVSDGYHTFDDLYAHRCRLFVALMRAYPNRSYWSRKHSDGSSFEGWVLAAIRTRSGWVTYHLPESEVPNIVMVREEEFGQEWDGHTSDDVLERLLTLG